MLNIVQFTSFQPEQLDRSIDGQTLAGAQAIVDTVRAEGEAGIRKYAAQFGERTDDQPLLIGPDEMNAARERIDSEDLALLCLLYTSPSPRDKRQSRMPSSA